MHEVLIQYCRYSAITCSKKLFAATTSIPCLDLRIRSPIVFPSNCVTPLEFRPDQCFMSFAEFQSLRRKPLCSMHLRATLRYCQPILPAESDGLSTAFKDAS